jgi:hypothetical protein
MLVAPLVLALGYEIVRDLEQQNHVLNIDAEAHRDQPFLSPRQDR